MVVGGGGEDVAVASVKAATAFLSRSQSSQMLTPPLLIPG